MKIKNTLRAMQAATSPGRWVSVWRGENPRPPQGSEREWARRRRQIIAGQIHLSGTREERMDAYITARKLNDAKRIILSGNEPDAPGFLERLRRKLAA